MAFSITKLKVQLLSVIICIGLLYSNYLQAEEILREKVEVADKLSDTLELEQLQKARDAVNETQARESNVLKSQLGNDWEAEQKEKAQKYFNERGSREDKYLREAKEAAAKKYKIPKS